MEQKHKKTFGYIFLISEHNLKNTCQLELGQLAAKLELEEKRTHGEELSWQYKYGVN